MVGPDGELVDQGNLSHHHGPPLVEMLPPIGPIGIVAIVVVANHSRPEARDGLADGNATK